MVKKKILKNIKCLDTFILDILISSEKQMENKKNNIQKIYNNDLSNMDDNEVQI